MRKTKTTGAIAAGALAATALTGVAVATTAIADDESMNSNAAAQNMTDADAEDKGHGPRGHRGGSDGFGGMGSLKGLAGKAMGMLHGEIVVEAEDGTYVTQQVQRGEVTAVSDTSITVMSEDGFDATYALDADTTLKRDREDGAAQVGDTVHVVGFNDGSTTTAEAVMAMSPEAAAEFEEKLESMKDWMSQRPEGAKGPGRPGGHDGMRG